MTRQVSHTTPRSLDLYPLGEKAWVEIVDCPKFFFSAESRRSIFFGEFPKVDRCEVKVKFSTQEWLPNFFGRGHYWFCDDFVANFLLENAQNKVELVPISSSVLDSESASKYFLIRIEKFVKAISNECRDCFAGCQNVDGNIYGKIDRSNLSIPLSVRKSKISSIDIWMDPTVLGRDMLYISDELFKILNNTAIQCLLVNKCVEI